MTKKKSNAEEAKNEKQQKAQNPDEDVKILTEEEVEQKAVEDANKKAEEYKEMLQRLQAEFDNYRKRTSENTRISRSDGICDVITELLPAIDNIERGLSLIKDESAKSGMEMILKQLSDVLKKFNVCEIEALNQPFNPDVHHAIAKEEGEDEQENKVSEVYVKGYQRNNKVLRPAMVKVSNK